MGLQLLRARLRYTALALILVFWTFLYLPHLRTSPPWYGDETLALGVALNLTHGIAANQGIWNTFWHPSVPYQPFYLAIIGVAARVFNSDILGARLINALLALGIALILYRFGRRLIGHLPACFASLMFLSYEQTVIHFRYVFTHNLVAFGFTIAFLTLARRRSSFNEWIAGLGLAVAAGAMPIFLYGIVPAVLFCFRTPRSLIRVLLPPIFMVVFSLSLGWLLHRQGCFLKDDMKAMAQFYLNSSRSSSGTLHKAFNHLQSFFRQDGWHLAGFFLLVLSLFGKKTRIFGAAGLMIALLLIQNRGSLILFYYQAVLFLPFLFFSYGMGLYLISRHLRSYLGIRRLRWIQGAAFLLPLACAVWILPQSIQGRLHPRNSYFTTQSYKDIEAAAAWLNRHTDANDLVLCNSTVAWLLHARTANYVQAAVWIGNPVWPYVFPLSRSEFRYPISFELARYWVTGDIDMHYTLNLAGMLPVVANSISQNGTRVWHHGLYSIYERGLPIPDQ